MVWCQLKGSPTWERDLVVKIILCVLAILAALPAAAQRTVELSTRTFWLGEQPSHWGDDPNFISIRRIDWIEEIIGVDPVLGDAVVHIEAVHPSSIELIFERDERLITLTAERYGPHYVIPGYRILAHPAQTARHFRYFPEDTEAGYHVRCSLTQDHERLSLCVVLATYPADPLIRLKARLYFPPDPIERPTYFRDIVDRMREVAACLDVTGEPVFRTAPPPLSDCDGMRPASRGAGRYSAAIFSPCRALALAPSSAISSDARAIGLVR